MDDYAAPRIQAVTSVPSVDVKRRYLQPHEVLAFVVARDDQRSVVTLLLLRSRGDGGFWHCIAGGVEPGESAMDAARREVDEETGFSDAPVVGPLHEYEYLLSEESPDRRALFAPGTEWIKVTCFRAELPDPRRPVLNEEHTDYRWCSLDEAEAIYRYPQVADALRICSALT